MWAQPTLFDVVKPASWPPRLPQERMALLLEENALLRHENDMLLTQQVRLGAGAGGSATGRNRAQQGATGCNRVHVTQQDATGPGRSWT